MSTANMLCLRVVECFARAQTPQAATLRETQAVRPGVQMLSETRCYVAGSDRCPAIVEQCAERNTSATIGCPRGSTTRSFRIYTPSTSCTPSTLPTAPHKGSPRWASLTLFIQGGCPSVGSLFPGSRDMVRTVTWSGADTSRCPMASQRARYCSKERSPSMFASTSAIL